jgi:redox-sensitive bicupin YhaK (pirin superfamily)
VRVFAGALPGVDAEASVSLFSPLVGAQIDLPAGGEAWIELDPGFEHGVLVDLGPVQLSIPPSDDEDVDALVGSDPIAVAGRGATLQRAELGYLPPRHEGMRLRALDRPVRVVLLGGTPFGEELVMWWNFIGRSHDEVAEYRRQWQADVIGRDNPDGRFGTVAGYPGEPLPAPELPTVRLKPRS